MDKQADFLLKYLINNDTADDHLGINISDELKNNPNFIEDKDELNNLWDYIFSDSKEFLKDIHINFLNEIIQKFRTMKKISVLAFSQTEKENSNYIFKGIEILLPKPKIEYSQVEYNTENNKMNIILR